ncbi:MAG: bifunctional N-acetylglucosamine-1-phosphate uridyltransferase/glucosamine-1-phosphate acetyltransferase [Candidatus Omnitrophica bacterium]|nr:bifunctional N-acetylglucosamine-1-phosphate uridyltransferase/glucosamine-1-phosphate acetyltransferase [Candidatus Omnitrophota bacterium]
MKDTVGIILAAGEGTRMNSTLPKVLHKLCGKPMLQYLLDILGQLGIKKNVVVVGHQAQEVRQILKNRDIKIVRQAKLLGSADAVWQTHSFLARFKGNLLIVYGDTPLISYQSLEKLIRAHEQTQAACTLLSAVLKNPSGYGRIVRSEDNRVLKIVEEQDADNYEKAIAEINVGAYCFRAKELFSALKEIKPNNVKKEYYLTTAIELLNKRKAKVEAILTADEQEAQGVNSRQDLAFANTVINKRNIEKLLSQGVTIVDPANTYIYGDVQVGQDTVIYPQSVIEGQVKIGRACQIGPFAHLRSGTILADHVAIGNFVEVVRSSVGCGSKIKHHAYIGDTIIGQAVNVGAGTIVANYDGKSKSKTLIADGAFIGTGSILIAPVKIGKKAITGAGSVITKNKNVPAGATVIGVPAKILKKRNSKRKIQNAKL